MYIGNASSFTVEFKTKKSACTNIQEKKKTQHNTSCISFFTIHTYFFKSNLEAQHKEKICFMKEKKTNKQNFGHFHIRKEQLHVGWGSCKIEGGRYWSGNVLLYGE